MIPSTRTPSNARRGTGDREYWLVDPELDVVKVFRRASGVRLPKVAELSLDERDVLTTPLLDGFSLPLDTLFVHRSGSGANRRV